jgi:hypothetical protein
MKKSLILSALFFVSGPIVFAQQYVQKMQEPNANFYDIKQSFDAYWSTHDRNEKGKGYKAFMRWADFVDPLDAIGARFANRGPRLRKDGREVSEVDRKHLKVMGLDLDSDRRTLRSRYAELLRRYHPDHNGGDRSHDKALQAVIEAYTALKARPAFA